MSAWRSSASGPRTAISKSRSAGGRLPREQLALDVAERLELECVASRVEEEHRGLLSHLPLEASVGLDHELDAEAREPFRQRAPLLHLQHHSAMGHRHAVSIHRVEMAREPPVLAQIGVQMADELMPVEIEVHPIDIAAALRTS